MKKIQWLFLIAVLGMFSCSNDRDPNTIATNPNLASLTFNGRNYAITDAKEIHNYSSFSNRHEYRFLMADCNITVGGSFSYSVPIAKRFFINLKMIPNGETLVNGSYTFDRFGTPDDSFFNECRIEFDTNNDGFCDASLDASEGTVTVSGTAPSNSLHFQLILSDGQPFDFTYTGGFEYFEG